MYTVNTNRITQFGEQALIILASVENVDGSHKIESFCIFPPPHVGYSFNHATYLPQDFINSPISLDQAFLNAELSTITKLVISDHISLNYSSKSFTVFPGELTHQPDVFRVLANFRMRDQTMLLDQIEKLTQCVELKQILQTVLKLKPKTYEPFDVLKA